jgi:hypothetical protein
MLLQFLQQLPQLQAKERKALRHVSLHCAEMCSFSDKNKLSQNDYNSEHGSKDFDKRGRTEVNMKAFQFQVLNGAWRSLSNPQTPI